MTTYNVHWQITTLTTIQRHPVMQNMPFDLQSARKALAILQPGMGVVNLNFHDRRRPENYLSLTPRPENGDTELYIHYPPEDSQKQAIRNSLKRLRGAFAKTGSFVIPGTVLGRPMGASVHYSGTLAMNEVPSKFGTDKNCRSYEFENLYIVDGSPMPFLPAKNITLTLMANAVRVAEEAF